jgi:tight adherence protein C
MNNTLDIASIPGLVAIFIGIAAFFTVYAIVAPFTAKKRDSIQDEVFGEEEAFVPTDSLGKYVRPILSNFLPQLPAGLISGTRRRGVADLLVKAGNPWKVTPEEFIGLQLVFTMGGFIVGSALGFTGLLSIIPPLALVIGISAIGFFIPYSIYNTRKENRTKQIQRQLPEALDLLTVTLSSGQTFEPALRSVTAQLPEGLLRQEFTKINVELQAGSTLERSLTSFYKTNAAEEAESFSKAVIQTQKLGSDVSETLSQQSDFARSNYESRLERMIARLSTTMFIPLIITMLPAFLIIFIIPTLFQLQGFLF